MQYSGTHTEPNYFKIRKRKIRDQRTKKRTVKQGRLLMPADVDTSNPYSSVWGYVVYLNT